MGKCYISKYVQAECSRSIMDTLLNFGTDINEIDEYGKNALYYASKVKEDEKLKKYLISKGAKKVKEPTDEYIKRKIKKVGFIIRTVPF